MDFPGGPAVKNPPANAGNMDSIPGPGGSHMPWSNEVRVPLLTPEHSRVVLHKRSHRNEDPAPRTATQRTSLATNKKARSQPKQIIIR